MDKKDWFKKRWERLGDISELLKVAAPQYTNPHKYYEDLIENEENDEIADKRLKVLESLVIVDEEEKLELELERLRVERDIALRQTDYTQLPDVPLASSIKQQYRAYRKYLRELPRLVKNKQLEIGVVSFEDWCEWMEETKYAKQKYF